MKIESYKQGTPCWICLGTPDVNSGKEFYSTLFGWKYQEAEMFPGVPDSPVVFNAKIGDELAGVIAPNLGEPDAPAAWAFNWAVDDVDESVEKTSELGGSLTMPPMDMADQGRVAVVADPNGNDTILWQAKEHIGAGVMFEHGTFTWAQLITRNRSVSTSFDRELLGLGHDSGPAPGGGYNDVLMLGDEPMVGITEMAEDVAAQGTPNHWIIYFHVDDVDATVELAESSGGTTIMVPNQLAHIGRIAVISDPQGAMLGLVTPTEHEHHD